MDSFSISAISRKESPCFFPLGHPQHGRVAWMYSAWNPNQLACSVEVQKAGVSVLWWTRTRCVNPFSTYFMSKYVKGHSLRKSQVHHISPCNVRTSTLEHCTVLFHPVSSCFSVSICDGKNHFRTWIAFATVGPRNWSHFSGVKSDKIGKSPESVRLRQELLLGQTFGFFSRKFGRKTSALQGFKMV